MAHSSINIHQVYIHKSDAYLSVDAAILPYSNFVLEELYQIPVIQAQAFQKDSEPSKERHTPSTWCQRDLSITFREAQMREELTKAENRMLDSGRV